jgi:hypothetical protein
MSSFLRFGGGYVRTKHQAAFANVAQRQRSVLEGSCHTRDETNRCANRAEAMLHSLGATDLDL